MELEGKLSRFNMDIGRVGGLAGITICVSQLKSQAAIGMTCVGGQGLMLKNRGVERVILLFPPIDWVKVMAKLIYV